METSQQIIKSRRHSKKTRGIKLLHKLKELLFVPCHPRVPMPTPNYKEDLAYALTLGRSLERNRTRARNKWWKDSQYLQYSIPVLPVQYSTPVFTYWSPYTYQGHIPEPMLPTTGLFLLRMYYARGQIRINDAPTKKMSH